PVRATRSSGGGSRQNVRTPCARRRALSSRSVTALSHSCLSRVAGAGGPAGKPMISNVVLRWLTAGESHGPQLTVVVEGLPAGLELTADALRRDLRRRQGGHGRGGRQQIEVDEARIVGGVRGGLTLGSPVALVLENRDHANWTEQMTPAPEGFAPRPVTRLRPGHADLAGVLKYGHEDVRNVLERSSARET